MLRLVHSSDEYELKFLNGCSMTYSFSGSGVTLADGHFMVFWAARPHRMIHVEGEGSITNAYVSLSQFLQWRLPSHFTNAMLSGSVLTTTQKSEMDSALTEKWTKERQLDSPQ